MCVNHCDNEKLVAFKKKKIFVCLFCLSCVMMDIDFYS